MFNENINHVYITKSKKYEQINFINVVFASDFFSNFSFGQDQTFTNGDSLAIRKSSHDFEVAFNAHDAKAFAALFLAKAEFTNVVGQSAKGRKEIEEFHAPMFEGKPGYTHLRALL
jgi:hypothetical protein